MNYRIKQIIRNIKSFLFPRQKWLTQQIPDSWLDKDSIFEIILPACLIHFIEEEKCFEVTKWETEEEKKYKKQLEDIYYWYKISQKVLQHKIDVLMEDLYGEGSGGFNVSRNPAKIAVLDKLEKELYDTNTKCMVWLIENRNILWT